MKFMCFDSVLSYYNGERRGWNEGLILNDLRDWTWEYEICVRYTVKEDEYRYGSEKEVEFVVLLNFDF